MKHKFLFALVAGISTTTFTLIVWQLTGFWYVGIILGGVPAFAVTYDLFETDETPNLERWPN